MRRILQVAVLAVGVLFMLAPPAAGMSGVVLVGDIEPPLTTEPISTTREDSSSTSPVLFGVGVVAIMAGVVAGRLTAKRAGRA